MIDLRGTSVLVTGGASGIGSGVVELAQQLGARVGVLDLTRAEEAEVSLKVDVSRADEVAPAVTEAAGHLGGLDVLVNNAGVAPTGSLDDTTAEDWRRTIAVNLDGTFYCTQAAAPELRRSSGAAVVNVASIAGRSYSRTAGVAYAASKGGVVALTRQLGHDLAPDGIRVNCVCPGLVDTGIIQQNTTAAGLRDLLSSIPLGRLAAPHEVASVICFLASPASSYMTGAVVDLNGGLC